MPRFAHNESGSDIDVMEFADEAAYRANFTPEAQTGWTVIQLADDWQPPAPIVAAPVPEVVDPTLPAGITADEAATLSEAMAIIKKLLGG